MKLQVDLPDLNVVTSAELYTSAVPRVCPGPGTSSRSRSRRKRRMPAVTATKFSVSSPGKNRAGNREPVVATPPRGTYVFQSPADKHAVLADDGMRGQSDALYELALNYGEVDLRQFWEEGIVGSIVGRVATGFEGLARDHRAAVGHGRARIRISRVDEVSR